MRCERIQELILTDHMDGELSEKMAREIDEHVRICAKCRDFKRIAAGAAAEPFKLTRTTEAPSYIWERVKQKIAAEGAESSGILAGMADIIRNIFWSLGKILKPAVVFAAAAAIIIAILIARPIAQTRAANDYIAEQMDFIMKLDVAETNGNGNFFYDTDV